MAGKRVKCKHCGKVFAIPAETGPQDEGDAGLSAIEADAHDTGTPVGSVAKSGSRTGAAVTGGGGAGKLGAASAGYASRMARNENAAEIDFASDSAPSQNFRPAIPYAFPGASAIDQLAPPILIILGLGWLALAAYQSASQPAGLPGWVGILRVVLYVGLCVGLAFPLGLWSIKNASRNCRFMLPRSPAKRALASFALPFTLAFALWLSGQSIGMLITGTILGLLVALGAVWFLFRVQPQEMPVAFGGATAAVVGSVVIAYFVLFGIHWVFAAAAAKSGANTLAFSPVAPTFEWNVPVAGQEDKLKPKKHLVINDTQPSTQPDTESITFPSNNATRPSATTQAGTQPYNPDATTTAQPPVDPSKTIAMNARPGTQANPQTLPPGTSTGPANTATTNTKPKTATPTEPASPLVAKVAPVADLDEGTSLFFPSGPGNVVGTLKVTPLDETVEFYSGNALAKVKTPPDPFPVEKNVQQHYVLSSNGDTMARMVAFPQLGVQLVNAQTGKELKQVPLDTRNGTPQLLGFGPAENLVLVWTNGPIAKPVIEVLNWRLPTPQRTTWFKVDPFERFASNPLISFDACQIAVATLVNGEGGIDLYDLGQGSPERKPRTLAIALPRWNKPVGLAYGPGNTVAVYFEIEGNGVMYAFGAGGNQPVHTHTYRSNRLPYPAGSTEGFAGRPLEYLDANEWVMFGRSIIDTETGKVLGELGVENPKAQRVIDKDTLLIQQADPATPGKSQLVQVKLKPDMVTAKRNEVRGIKPGAAGASATHP
ncbi:MAG TPA: hypothetical protein VH475_14160 [Tepidisphaeraceae bacterium]